MLQILYKDVAEMQHNLQHNFLTFKNFLLKDSALFLSSKSYQSFTLFHCLGLQVKNGSSKGLLLLGGWYTLP